MKYRNQASKYGSSENEVELLSIDQVQHELNVGRSTVYNLINAGKLQSVKVGKYRRITRTSFNKYLEELYEQIEPRS